MEELESRYAELQCLFYEEQLDRKETLEECTERILEYFKTRQDDVDVSSVTKTQYIFSPLSSSQISGIAYDDTKQILAVQFQTGAIYEYMGVDRSVYESFLVAPSAGRFLNQHIKGIYSYRKIATEDDEEEVSEDEEESWPWPVTEVSASAGGGEGVPFAQEHSGLNLCGYKVEKQKGALPPVERKRLLDYFYRRKLPNVVEEIYGNAYGAPNSSLRLKKMARNIAWNCKNKKKISAGRYRVAIADWETDLKYLKKTYYDGRFNWPST